MSIEATVSPCEKKNVFNRDCPNAILVSFIRIKSCGGHSLIRTESYNPAAGDV